MAKKSRRSNDGPHIFWRNGRAYADLRTYADIGGGREALATRGSTWGTRDPDIALVLFEARLDDHTRRCAGLDRGTGEGRQAAAEHRPPLRERT